MVERAVIEQAQRIVQYETQDKGFFGRLFAFEARDGFWSKLVKVSSNIGAPVVFGMLGFALASATFGAASIAPLLVAAGTALIGGAASRFAHNSLLSDMHDSQKGALGKFGHYMTAGVLTSIATTLLIAGGMLIFGASSAATAATATATAATAATAAAATAAAAAKELGSRAIFTLMLPMASGAIASVLGDKQQMMHSEQARGLADVAMLRGQTIEQVLGQSVSQVMAPQQHLAAGAAAPNYVNSVTPEEYQAMQARIAQGAPKHEQRQAERAANPPQQLANA